MNEVEAKTQTDPPRLVLYDQATEQDYDVLRSLSMDKKVVFEFGTFIGGSALAMLPQIVEADGHLYCIDTFLGNPGDEQTTHPQNMVMTGLLCRLEPFLQHVTIIVGRTDVAMHFRKGFADLVFIDAEHGYHAVTRDILYAKHLVKPGGIICGHDYVTHLDECDPNLVERYAHTPDGGHEGVGYGVIKAVTAALGKPNHKSETAIWWHQV